MPARLCLEPRCPNPSAYRGRCPDHARTQEQATHPNKPFYNTKAWQILRRRVLFEEPICRICDNALSVDVDHIVPIEHGGPRLDRANCQGLCGPCHSAKTRREQQETRTR